MSLRKRLRSSLVSSTTYFFMAALLLGLNWPQDRTSRSEHQIIVDRGLGTKDMYPSASTSYPTRGARRSDNLSQILCLSSEPVSLVSRLQAYGQSSPCKRSCRAPRAPCGTA